MAELVVKVKGSGGPAASCEIAGKTFDCVVGRAGVTEAEEKREGDGKTPLGRWKIIGGFYRADKVVPPAGSEMVWVPLTREMGWCDDADDESYNRPCPVGYAASHEVLWRDDDAYDYILVLDHNQMPVVPGAGSAIFLHVWREGAAYTQGCIALRRGDLEEVLAAGVEAVVVKG